MTGLTIFALFVAPLASNIKYLLPECAVFGPVPPDRSSDSKVIPQTPFFG